MSSNSGKAVKWILLGCLGMIVLAGFGVAGCFIFLVRVTKPAADSSERFLQAMGAHDWVAAAKECDAGTAPGVEAAGKGNIAAWGKEWTLTGRSIETKNGLTTAKITAQVKGTDGTLRAMEIGLVDSGGWKVTGVSVDGKQVLVSGTAPAEMPVPGGPLRVEEVTISKETGGDPWKFVITFKARGMKGEARGDKQRIVLSEGVVLYAPDGAEMYKNPDFQSLDGEAEDPVATFTNKFDVPKKTGAGKYRVRVTLKDTLSGETVTKDVDVQLP